MKSGHKPPLIAIACGGTGGHLFPGMAIADVLQAHGCDVALLISQKEIDHQAVQSRADFNVVKLPAVAFSNSRPFGFGAAFARSLLLCKDFVRRQRPRAILAMGGYTSAPPILAGKVVGASTFLHEANSIPGKAIRYLAPMVDEVFVAFPSAARRLACSSVHVTGMPVREQFTETNAASARMALGLAVDRPVLLVVGGSQGATGINELLIDAAPLLARSAAQWQILHLTGAADRDRVRAAYQENSVRAVVMPFLTEMELAMAAATVCVSRAGASSLAEIAALRLPSILLPYPHAADNHQYFNAKAYSDSGAARQLDQASATPAHLIRQILELGENELARSRVQNALAEWHVADAAEQVASRILRAIGHAAPRAVAADADAPMPRKFTIVGKPLAGAVTETIRS